MKMKNKNEIQPMFNLSTKVNCCDSSSIPPLPGQKKSYPNAKPCVDCWNNSISSVKSVEGKRKNVNARVNESDKENAQFDEPGERIGN